MDTFPRFDLEPVNHDAELAFAQRAARYLAEHHVPARRITSTLRREFDLTEVELDGIAPLAAA